MVCDNVMKNHNLVKSSGCVVFKYSGQILWHRVPTGTKNIPWLVLAQNAKNRTG